MKKRTLTLLLALALCLGIAAPAQAAEGGTYTAYSFTDFWGGVISCEAAKVHKETVQIRTRTTLIGGETELSGYQSREVTLVALRPGSEVTVTQTEPEGGMDSGMVIVPNGNGKFTCLYEDTVIYWLDEEQLRRDLQSSGVLVTGENGFYLIIYEDILNPDISFADVPSGAYCADAVAWAVQNGITTGTTATTFSPNSTCTVAQITTFLYRAIERKSDGEGERL